MANLDAVNIKKGKIGANRLDNTRSVSALVVSSPVLPLLDFKKTVQLYGLFDAEQYGIVEAFDTTNNVNVYRHIREFYRMAGEGTELNFMVVAQSETLQTITEDTAGDKLKRLLIDADFKVRQVAVALKVDSTSVFSEERGSREETKLRFKFPFEYTLTDASGHELHQEKTSISWNNGTKYSIKDKITTAGGWIQFETSFDKVKLNQNTYISEEKSPSQYPRYIKHINYMKYQQK